MAMRRTQIYLTDTQHKELVHLAAGQERTMAGVLREAVEEYLARRSDEGPLAAVTALGATGSPDSSEQHDAVLYDEL
jgi:hypothetical protein